MNRIEKALLIGLYAIAAIVSLFSFLSLFRNAELRFLKMLDFPRIQFFIVALISLIILLIITKKWKWTNELLVFGLLSGLIINGYFFINYTSLVPVEVPWAKALKYDDKQFSILLANVKMTNRNSQLLIDLIDQKKPDIVLAMEVDKWWSKELKVLEEEFPFTQQVINEEAYGLTLYSKFPLKKEAVNYLNNKKVPSFETSISLTNEKKVTFHAIHPVPPTHFENLPDNAGQKANALQKLGEKVKDRKSPTIVAGDLNDVVWSYVDELTHTKNILYDVRVGRGFYNSYNAANFFMRWPLDHVFVTKEFGMKKLERCSKIGSDHFPIYVELIL